MVICGSYGSVMLCCKLVQQEAFENVGPIRHCEPQHCHSPDVATVARRHCQRRLRIDVHNNINNDNNDNA